MSVQTTDPCASHYARGDRVFHQKFGYGRVSFVEGNKLTVDFDKAGEKQVIDQFVAGHDERINNSMSDDVAIRPCGKPRSRWPKAKRRTWPRCWSWRRSRRPC